MTARDADEAARIARERLQDLAVRVYRVTPEPDAPLDLLVVPDGTTVPQRVTITSCDPVCDENSPWAN